jgi:hypothetical protein
MQGGVPILAYHAAAHDPSQPWRMNFIHPLVAPSGAILTEDAPIDHPHHRGLFWAWRRVILDGQVIGDGWTGRDLSYDTLPVSVSQHDDAVEIATEITWIATRFQPALPFLRERCLIAVQQADGNRRTVTVDVWLRALRAGIALAGTDDEKGYGGPSIRFAHTEALRMESDGRSLAPERGPVRTGAVVDFSWHPRPHGFPRRVSVACLADEAPWTSWVLRRGASMQNAAFPGRHPMRVPIDRDLTLGLSVSIEP